MPKPKSKKKESDGTDLRKADSSLNDEKNETKKEDLVIEKSLSVNHIKEPKNKLNSFLLIGLSGLAAASFGLLGVLIINSYNPNFFKNNSQIVFEQNIQFRLKELSTSIKKLEIDLTNASKKIENFISERELATSLTKLESQIVSNKEEFDLKFLELGSIKKQLETNSVHIDSLETEIQSIMLMPLEKKQEKDVPKKEIFDKAKDNTEKSIPIDQSIQENFREIQKSTIHGTPYKTSLDNIERILGSKAPDILRNLAETGIPTMKNLKESFPKFSRLALSAYRNEKETKDFKFLTFLKSQFQARSTIPRQGSDPDAVLSRSEAFLKSNDLEKSLFELTQLDGIASKVMEPWRISAESRIESLLAVEQLLKSTEK